MARLTTTRFDVPVRSGLPGSAVRGDTRRQGRRRHRGSERDRAGRRRGSSVGAAPGSVLADIEPGAMDDAGPRRTPRRGRRRPRRGVRRPVVRGGSSRWPTSRSTGWGGSTSCSTTPASPWRPDRRHDPRGLAVDHRRRPVGTDPRRRSVPAAHDRPGRAATPLHRLVRRTRAERRARCVLRRQVRRRRTRRGALAELRAHDIGVSVLCPMRVSTNIGPSERNRPRRARWCRRHAPRVADQTEDNSALAGRVLPGSTTSPR